MVQLLPVAMWTFLVTRCICSPDAVSYQWCNFSRWKFAHKHSQKCSVLVWGAWRYTSTYSLANTITKLKYHRAPVISFRRVRSWFPPESSLRQLEDVLHEQYYNIPLVTIQTLYKFTPKRIHAVLQAHGLIWNSLFRTPLLFIENYCAK